MSHPHQEHRAHKHERARVHDLVGVHEEVRGHHQRARGGHVSHSDEAEDKAIVRKMVKKKALRADGGAVKARSDKAPRRARGGKVHHGKGHSKTNVNVIVAPGAGKAPMAGVGAAPPPMAAAPPMPPRPPMAPPTAPGPGAVGLPGPGGMPMRKHGGKVESDHHIESRGTSHLSSKRKGGHLFGKANMNKLSTANGDLYGDSHMKGYATGGSVADKRGVTGIGTRTPIQHSGNKSDTQNIGRGPVITRATGGPIYADGRANKHMGPHIGAGNSGVGRLRKNKVARAEHWEA